MVALAALNTGNNLLFMILACLLAGVLISGLLSRLVLSGVDVRLELPEHIFAGRPIMAIAELHNTKQTMPSFSVLLVSEEKQKTKKQIAANAAPNILARPVYFPHVPRQQTVRQNVELTFPRRGIYRQDALGLRTKFPFGFLQKTRRVDSEVEALVYPPVEPTEEFYEILPLVSGELESYQRGRGNDLYSIRDYQFNDSARHVDWKATARTGVLQVREYAREDERRVLLAFDPFLNSREETHRACRGRFERAVALCAGLAWHFYEINSVLEFRSAGFCDAASHCRRNRLRRAAVPGPRVAAEGAAGPQLSRFAVGCARHFQNRSDQPAARLDSHAAVEFLVHFCSCRRFRFFFALVGCPRFSRVCYRKLPHKSPHRRFLGSELNHNDAPTARRMPARGNAPGTCPSPCPALQGRRIPPPLQGGPIDSETQGVALGWSAAALSAPRPQLCKSDFTCLDGWPFIKMASRAIPAGNPDVRQCVS